METKPNWNVVFAFGPAAPALKLYPSTWNRHPPGLAALKFGHPAQDPSYFSDRGLELAADAAAFGAALALGLAALSLALKRAFESSSLSRAIALYLFTCERWKPIVCVLHAHVLSSCRLVNSVQTEFVIIQICKLRSNWICHHADS